MRNTIDVYVGTNLRLWRLASGHDVTSLAAGAGVCSDLWAKWEDGDARLSATDMYRLKSRLDINPSQLFAGLVTHAD